MSLTSKKVGENNIDLFKILRAFNTPQNIKSQFSGFLAKKIRFWETGIHCHGNRFIFKVVIIILNITPYYMSCIYK